MTSENLSALESQVKTVKWLLAGLGALALIFLVPFYDHGKNVSALAAKLNNHDRVIVDGNNIQKSIQRQLGIIARKVALGNQERKQIIASLEELKQIYRERRRK